MALGSGIKVVLFSALVLAVLLGFALLPANTASAQSTPMIYVINLVSNDVTVINPQTDTVVTTIPGVSAPRKIEATPDGTRVYTVGGVTATVIDTSTNMISDTFPLSRATADGLAISPNGKRAYAGASPFGGVMVLDINPSSPTFNSELTRILDAPVTISPDHMVVSPDSSQVFISDPNSVLSSTLASIIRVDAVTLTPTFGPDLGGSTNLVFDPDGSRLFLTDCTFPDLGLSIIDPTTLLPTTKLIDGDCVQGIAVSSDGKLVYAGDSTTDEIQVVDVDTSSPTFGDILANIPSDNLILDLILLPDDSKLYSVDRDANQVQVIDTLTNTELTRIDVGQFPLAIALSPSQQVVVGGELIPLDTTMILLAGAQMNAAWLIPVIVAATGIGIVLARKF